MEGFYIPPGLETSQDPPGRAARWRMCELAHSVSCNPATRMRGGSGPKQKMLSKLGTFLVLSAFKWHMIWSEHHLIKIIRIINMTTDQIIIIISVCMLQTHGACSVSVFGQLLNFMIKCVCVPAAASSLQATLSGVGSLYLICWLTVSPSVTHSEHNETENV